MNPIASFIDQCLAGGANEDAIDDFVDRWHEGGSGVPLWRFLGMTREEYGLWVENGDLLPAIVEAHRRGLPVASAAQLLGADDPGLRVAATWLRDRESRLARA